MTFQLLIWILIFGAFIELLDIMFPADPPEWWNKGKGSPEKPRAASDAGDGRTRPDSHLMSSKED